jgi:hypothetical protein
MRLLFLVHHSGPNGYQTKMSRVRFSQVAAMEKREEFFVHKSGPGWPDWNDAELPVDNISRLHKQYLFDIALVYNVEGLEKGPIPYATSFNEADDHQKVDRYVYDNAIELVVFHHQNDLPHYQHWEKDGIYRTHLYHCADETIYRDYGLPKTIDILVAGNLNKYYYPHRWRLKELAQKTFKKRGYIVKVLGHPGYTLPPREGTYIGEEFAKVINQSKMVFTCSMRYHYALAKYSEIALCRSLAVGDIPDERRDFFGETVLEAAAWMTDEEIIRRVEEVLDNETLLTHMTTRSYDLNTQLCTMGVYAYQFYNTALKFLLKKGYVKE